jgi:metallo-beta-lactamase family protein
LELLWWSPADVATHIHFLGAAGTVTGSQYLVETDRARVVIDCGMFQGMPGVRARNVVPLGYDPATLDALLVTHAHLDHCGLIPHVVKQGYSGPIYATHGTTELAALVLLDSGRLQQELNKREMRWEKRHPEKAAEDDAQELRDYQAALAQAAAGEALADSPAMSQPGDMASREHVPTSIEAALIEATASEASEVEATTLEQPDHVAHEMAPDPNLDLDAPLYDEKDARAALLLFKPVRYDAELEVAPGVHARFVDAGHILGSAIIVLRVEGDAGEDDLTIVFSGDLGRPGAPILRDYTTLTQAAYVLVETTYGGREHEPEDEARQVLAETVRLVAENEGVLLVPTFAVGRTQDLIYELDRLIDEGAIPLLPLYLDSPMASKATAIYRRHVEYFDTEAGERQRSGDTPLDYPKQIVTNDVRDSQKIATAPRPHMIIASNGMLTGGRVVGHLPRILSDPDAILLFVGYQAPGTLGAHLQAGAREVKVEGRIVNVTCQVRSISGFSAHADESQLLDWLRGFAGAVQRPRRIFLVHGDPEAQVAIEPKIRALGLETMRPQWRERVTLD